MAKLDLLQGTLDLLILKTLNLGPQHGWGISQRIQQISDNVLRVPNAASVVTVCWSRDGDTAPTSAATRVSVWRSGGFERPQAVTEATTIVASRKGRIIEILAKKKA